MVANDVSALRVALPDIVYTFQVAGGSVGLGLTTTVFTTASEDRLQGSSPTGTLTEGQREAVQGVPAGSDSAVQALAQLPARAGDRVVELVREAFAAGMQWGFRLVAVLALIGFVVTLLFVAGSLLGRRGRDAGQIAPA